MPRKHRIVVPSRPHHVIQRGNRRQQVFFYPGDKNFYLQLLKEYAQEHHVEIWAYCLMDNHVHMILVPHTHEGFAKTIAETNRRYTRYINARYKWQGYLWQGRFISYVMDEIYLVKALRYVENNPVRAKIVTKAWDYLWSSVRHHVGITIDPILSNCREQGIIGDWKEYLIKPEVEGILDEIRKRNLSGLPLGESAFLDKLADQLGVTVAEFKPKKNGRPKKS